MPARTKADSLQHPKLTLANPAFANTFVVCSPFVLSLELKSLCPPWQSVSRKRRNKAGSFCKAGFCMSALCALQTCLAWGIVHLVSSIFYLW